MIKTIMGPGFQSEWNFLSADGAPFLIGNWCWREGCKTGIVIDVMSTFGDPTGLDYC